MIRTRTGAFDTSTTQERNGLNHKRTYNPSLEETAEEIRDLLKGVLSQLELITGEKHED